jgi:hypothetical protein
MTPLAVVHPFPFQPLPLAQVPLGLSMMVVATLGVAGLSSPSAMLDVKRTKKSSSTMTMCTQAVTHEDTHMTKR